MKPKTDDVFWLVLEDINNGWVLVDEVKDELS